MTIEQTIALMHDCVNTLGLEGAIRHADCAEALAADTRDSENERVWSRVGKMLRGSILLPAHLGQLVDLEVAA